MPIKVSCSDYIVKAHVETTSGVEISILVYIDQSGVIGHAIE